MGADVIFEQLYVGGSWVHPADSSTFVVRSPHDGGTVGRTPVATGADVDRAVAAACQAFDQGPWRRMPAGDRAAAIEPLLAAYAARSDDLAALISGENGSPLTFSQLGQVGSIPLMVQGYLDAAGTRPGTRSSLASSARAACGASRSASSPPSPRGTSRRC